LRLSRKLRERFYYSIQPLSIDEQSRRDKGEHVEPQPDTDPYAYVMSANIHRRHLDPEQKRELIAKLIKATPDKSNRQIAEMVKASPTTVGTVRAEMESTVQIGQLPKRVGKDGKSRAQPNRARARIYRTTKLGEDTIAKLVTASASVEGVGDALLAGCPA
jgi:hypothetical protein